MRELLRHGAPPDGRTREEWEIPLRLAVSYPVPYDWTDFRHYDVRHPRETPERLAILEALLDAGADVDGKPDDAGGETSLMCAISDGAVAAAAILIRRGAALRRRDLSGWNAYQYAVMWESPVRRLILRAGYQPTARDRAWERLDPAGMRGSLLRGESPLNLAVDTGNVELIREFLQAGYDIDETGRYAMGPIFHALDDGSVACLRLLVTAHADLNVTDPAEATPLMRAAEAGQVRAVRLLLDAGAATATRNPWTEDTALSLARANGHIAVVRLLQSRGVRR